MFKRRSMVSTTFGKFKPTGLYDGRSFTVTNSRINKPVRDCEAEIKLAVRTAIYDKTWGPHPSYSGDETFSSTTFKRPKWNSCDHIKHNCNFSYPISYVQWPGGFYSATCLYPQHYGYTTAYDYSIPGVTEPSEFTRARAWATMLPRFESDFQALNFIFELKDFRDVGGRIAGLLRDGPLNYSVRRLDPNRHKDSTGNTVGLSFSTIRKRQRSLTPSKKPLTAAQAFEGGVNSVAEAWLLNSMAIQPFLKDLVAFRAAIATEYLDFLDKFKKSGLKPNTRHYSEMLSDSTYKVGDVNVLYTGEHRRLIYAKFTANLQYQYKYTLNDTTEAFRRYWGLTGTAEEFWNMLPFSFLLDYIFTVAKSLKLSEVDKNLDLAVLNYSESVLSMNGHAVGFTGNPSNSCGYWIDGAYYKPDGRFRPITGAHSSRYTRVLTQPQKHGLLLPQWKLPRLNQAYNAGALLKLLLF